MDPPATIRTATVTVAMIEAAAALAVMTLKVHITRTTILAWGMDVEEETSVAEEEVMAPPIVVVVAQVDPVAPVVQVDQVIPIMMLMMRTPIHQKPVPTAPLLMTCLTPNVGCSSVIWN